MFNEDFRDTTEVYAIYHGEWEEYTPESGGEYEDELIKSSKFLRRKSDGVCFYKIRALMFDNNTITLSAIPVEGDNTKSLITSISGSGMPAWADQKELWEVVNLDPTTQDIKQYLNNTIIRATGEFHNKPIGKQDVEEEKFTRIANGFYFRGVKFQSRQEDRENIQGAYAAANTAITDGAVEGDLYWQGTGSPFMWIAEDNSLFPMDAFTTRDFGNAALLHKQQHIFAASAIKALVPIPSDFRDDIFWPIVSEA